MFNDFEEIVIKKFPQVGEVKKALIDCGAAKTLMSGSGPTVFGVFKTRRKAEESYGNLNKHKNWQAWICQPIN